LARPTHIDPKTQSEMDFVKVTARDGLRIPTYITFPVGKPKKNLPMIVLVHGGPWVRGQSWGWDREVQFLASRGYAVIEPQFRGSTGFGMEHFKKGWKQWGLAMQDDLADAAQWAINEGIADPKRICIAGASYGGYAATMGLIMHPELFRCAVNWVGVTDIDLLFSPIWSDINEESKRYGMKTMIGDPEKDGAQFKATSPIVNAHKIKQPILLAYGERDERVPIIHGTKLRDALKVHNQNVEWIAYENEGHSWARTETKIDFWTRVEQFLTKHNPAN
jgi:dipeptidyl aminopeptidase/acylaminoacyl peptidase